ncbi:MAG: NAD(P)-dependent dehydrogenase (short-subunit alcohol dehydrogenase family) [Alphaproteobacteria bacterium]|jgi:NAD(P)-dependent dehydrogenase (short-subunit alcohol dehydrogenase family)
MMYRNIVIIGGSGTLGHEFTQQLSTQYPQANIHAFSRNIPTSKIGNINKYAIDYKDEDSIQKAAALASKDSPLDMVIVAIGILHDADIMPEKALSALSAEKFQYIFEVNTIYPALIAKHFLPHLNRNSRSLFAALSARVGSISDNKLGGWYAYRASKAALNMTLKNTAIEIERKNKNAIVVGIHPGTVDSKLSKPFQRNVPEGKLFTAADSVNKMLEVLERLTPTDSGKCFGWDNEEIKP